MKITINLMTFGYLTSTLINGQKSSATTCLTNYPILEADIPPAFSRI